MDANQRLNYPDTSEKFLVTGASGLVGSEVVDDLLKRHYTVYGVDNAEQRISHYRYSHYKVDLRDEKNVELLFSMLKPNYVIHLASVKGSVFIASSHAHTILDSVLRIDLNVMRESAKRSVKWFVYTSSIGVYSPSVKPHKETDPCHQSKNDWFAGYAKCTGERTLAALEAQHGFKNYTILRCSNIFGDNEDMGQNANVTGGIMRRILECRERTLTLHGTGESVRDFIYARNVADSIFHTMSNGLNGVFNIGSGYPSTIRAYANLVAEALGKKIKIKWGGEAGGDPFRVLDIKKIRSTGFSNNINLMDGIKQTVEHIQLKNDLTGKAY